MDSISDSAIYQSRDHALHNEEACDYLNEREEFGDWVITTAFYSALHWMRYHLFPRTEEEEGEPMPYQSFDEYLQAKGAYEPPHRHMISLVRDNCPGVASQYRSLYDVCMTARYKRYQSKRELVTKARKCLTAIREFCDKPKA